MGSTYDLEPLGSKRLDAFKATVKASALNSFQLLRRVPSAVWHGRVNLNAIRKFLHC